MYPLEVKGIKHSKEIEVKKWLLKVGSQKGFLNNEIDLSNMAILVESLDSSGLSNDGEKKFMNNFYK